MVTLDNNIITSAWPLRIKLKANAEEARQYLINNVGAFPRTTFTQALIDELTNRTGRHVVDPSDLSGVDGYPTFTDIPSITNSAQNAISLPSDPWIGTPWNGFVLWRTQLQKTLRA